MMSLNAWDAGEFGTSDKNDRPSSQHLPVNTQRGYTNKATEGVHTP